MTGDLVERLRAKIDEAEKIAQAVDDQGDWWEPDDLTGGGVIPLADAALIAANGPAVVLRTIQAHRKIIDRHARGVSHPDECGRCNDPYPCDDVRSIAAIYLPDIETGDTPSG